MRLAGLFQVNTSIFLLGLVASSRASATAIAIVTDVNHQIVVTADSKVYKKTETLCKLFKTGPIFWAMSGDIDQYGTYNVPALVKSSVTKGKTVSGTFLAFNSAVLPSLEFLKQGMIKEFGVKRIIDYPHILSIAFFAFENGKSIIQGETFDCEYDQVTKEYRVRPHIKDPIVGVCPGQGNVCAMFVGTDDILATYFSTHRWADDLLYAGSKAIEETIKAHPEGVGPPISIWRIFPDNSVVPVQNGCALLSVPPPRQSLRKY